MTNDFSDCEYAWASSGLGVARIFRFVWNGMIQGNMKTKENRFHPTQKPVALYEWILNRYAKEGDKILDTHVGSASSLIACRNTNHKYVGFEIDEDYYQKAKDRLDKETAQMNIFDFM
jgi:site-specific DNA-methyltransferase (adenine-specific)